MIAFENGSVFHAGVVESNDNVEVIFFLSSIKTCAISQERVTVKELALDDC